ncbi:NUDIX domain-containing protein [Motilibacter sp. E257]|uniref:NUDIX domain-containing protein n=1 Tax=Motilibacter deserti TaxID=2714956 RepID=A0ABX0GUG2_9ACTN|nr:NUDIX domain-containing protein [Motilibacter deserti]NHC13776.1 NUDIX domain-containing protein [Motilibacter deserti]
MGATGTGDGWTQCAAGHRHWGRVGAAGLLLVAEGSALLQLRAAWSHEGGTWGIPGGARDVAEDAVAAALRETAEEAGVEVPPGAVTGELSIDHGGWSYTTVLARVARRLPATPVDGESAALEWVPLDEVADRPLHPGLADAWPLLRPAAGRRLRLVVDGANVVGSRPDGWWRDRRAAAARLREELAGLRVPGAALPPELGLPALQVWAPETVLVVEGAAAGLAAGPAVAGVRVVAASRTPGHRRGAGDDEVVHVVAAGRAAATDGPDGPDAQLVVTSDRELRRRCADQGVPAVGTSWLRRLLEERRTPGGR